VGVVGRLCVSFPQPEAKAPKDLDISPNCSRTIFFSKVVDRPRLPPVDPAGHHDSHEPKRIRTRALRTRPSRDRGCVQPCAKENSSLMKR
jgi:hypothetical protein